MVQGNLVGRIAVVTGATAGIGRYTALGLARRGALVVVTGRDPARLADTAAWLKENVPAAQIEAEQADFTSFAQIRAMAGRIAARHPKLDILVNNAGMVTTARTVTADGYEAIFQANHLAPFLLTHLLLPALRAAGKARIVTVASRAAHRARLDLGDLQLSGGWGVLRAYGRSKLANIMFTYALARRLQNSGVTANCLHPGLVATRIGNKGLFSGLIWRLATLFALNSSEGAETSIFAAAAPEMEGVSGQFLNKKRSARSNRNSYDEAAQEQLWKLSAEMTGIGE